MKRRIMFGVALLLLAVVSTGALFAPCARWTPGHDLPFHLARIQSIAQGLRAGVIPVRLYATQAHGFGYPTGLCYPDLFLYLPGLLVAWGMHPWPAYVVFVLLVNLATAAVAYYAFSTVLRSPRAGLVCATLWTLSPYRLCDVLLRAAVGEYLALVFAPLIVLGLWRVFLDDTTQEGAGWITLALGASGILYSHILSVIMFLPVSLLAMLPLARRRKKDGWGRAIAKAAVLTLLLCAAFLVPFFDYYLHHDLGVKYFGNSAYEHSLYPGQFLIPFWPFDGLSLSLDQGLLGEMPLQIGLSLTVVLVLGFVWLRVPSVRAVDAAADGAGSEADGVEKLADWVGLLAWASLIVLLLTTCLFPWGLAGPLATIQFPWRLLGVASLLLVVLAGVLMGCTSLRLRTFWIVCLAVCLVEGVYCGVSFALHAQPLDVTATTVEGDDIGMGEYVPIQQSKDFFDDWDSAEPVAPAGVEVRDFARVSAQETRVALANTTDRTVRVRLPLFWHQQLTLEPTQGATLAWDDGYAALDLAPHADGTYTVTFVEPLVWRIAELVSALTLLALVAVSIRARGTVPRARMHVRR